MFAVDLKAQMSREASTLKEVMMVMEKKEIEIVVGKVFDLLPSRNLALVVTEERVVQTVARASDLVMIKAEMTTKDVKETTDRVLRVDSVDTLVAKEMVMMMMVVVVAGLEDMTVVEAVKHSDVVDTDGTTAVVAIETGTEVGRKIGRRFDPSGFEVVDPSM